MDTAVGGEEGCEIRHSGFDLVERVLTWVLGIVVVAVSLVLVLPALGGDYTPRAAIRSAVPSHIRELGQSTQMYSHDFDDRIPLESNWMTGLSKYEPNRSIFHAPDLPKGGGDAYGFAFRRRLSGKVAHALPESGKTAMIFESVLLQWNASSELWSLPDPGRSPGGKDAVAFADGHAKTVTPEQGRALR